MIVAVVEEQQQQQEEEGLCRQRGRIGDGGGGGGRRGLGCEWRRSAAVMVVVVVVVVDVQLQNLLGYCRESRSSVRRSWGACRVCSRRRRVVDAALRTMLPPSLMVFLFFCAIGDW